MLEKKLGIVAYCWLINYTYNHYRLGYRCDDSSFGLFLPRLCRFAEAMFPQLFDINRLYNDIHYFNSNLQLHRYTPVKLITFVANNLTGSFDFSNFFIADNYFGWRMNSILFVEYSLIQAARNYEAQASHGLFEQAMMYFI